MRKRQAGIGQAKTAETGRAGEWPRWAPVATHNYLAHVEGGQTIRALAKEADVHPSTMLRRVRRVEAQRDDPLFDAALRRIARPQIEAPPDPALLRAAVPALRCLCQASTILAFARDMEKAVIARERPNTEPQRLLVLDREVVEEMAVRGWIACLAPEARVQRYRIAAKGKSLLRDAALLRRGLAEAPAAFAPAPAPDDEADARVTHMRSLLADSPLLALSRRRDDTGAPFLNREQLAAGDRLREDFELARGEVREATDWDAFLAALATAGGPAGDDEPEGPSARLRAALVDLGPGMADVALRCCCLLEGLEAIERQLGWSARSGKVVLRIALSRLAQHYRVADALIDPLIG